MRLSRIKSGLLAAVLSFGFAVPAFAVGPISSTIFIPQKVASYSVSASVTPGTTGTDFLTVAGSATMVQRIKYVTCSGVATAAGSQAFSMVMRSTLDTGGTAGSVPTKAPNDPNDVASLATPATYTAPPTLGTVYSVVYQGYLSLGTATAASAAQRVPFGENYDKEPTLRGAASQFAIDLGGTVAAGTVVACTIEYTEAAN